MREQILNKVNKRGCYRLSIKSKYSSSIYHYMIKCELDNLVSEGILKVKEIKIPFIFLNYLKYTLKK